MFNGGGKIRINVGLAIDKNHTGVRGSRP